MKIKLLKQKVTLLPHVTEKQAHNIIGAAVSTPYAKKSHASLYKQRIQNCMSRGHTSILEHVSLSMDCLTNIETYKCFTRHRHCAFTIESTNYTDPVKAGVINVIMSHTPTEEEMLLLQHTCDILITHNNQKEARDYLPQCTAARMIMTTNIREWQYILALRKDPHTSILVRELNVLIEKELNKWSSFFFPIVT